MPATVRVSRTRASEGDVEFDVPRGGALPRAQRVRFRRASALSLMTLFMPGSAQLVCGNKAIGRFAIRVWIVCLGIISALAVIAIWLPQTLVSLAANPTFLALVRIVLVSIAIGWALLFWDAWRLGQPATLESGQRKATIGIHGVIALGVTLSLLFAAHLAGVQRNFIMTMFSDGEAEGAHNGRYNVLLLGGDAGAGRTGLRPDSLTVASVDAQTGRTVLVSLPRNLSRFKFAPGSVMDEQFPRGWNCADCYLNAVSTWATDHPSVFGKTKQPGVAATIMAVEGITGLEINYWAMVNLDGFKDLVDAVGGVKLRVRAPIPVGGLGDDVTGYIQPGDRVLNGRETLWFARAREGSDDYSRMARQKCVMGALLNQVSPQVALQNFQAIASASQGMVTTNLPASEVDRFVTLGAKAKSHKISTVSLVPPQINTTEPNLAKIKRMVAQGIARSAESETTKPKPRKRNHSTGLLTGGSLGSHDQGYLANQSDDLSTSC